MCVFLKLWFSLQSVQFGGTETSLTSWSFSTCAAKRRRLLDVKDGGGRGKDVSLAAIRIVEFAISPL